MSSPNPEPSPEPLSESPEYQAFRKFARLTALKRELNEQLRGIEPQLRALEPVLLGYLGENGYQMVKVEGFTLSPKRVPWIYPLDGVERQAVCEALKLSGLGRLVYEAYSTAALTAYISELEEHQRLIDGSDPSRLRELLPAPLAHVVDVRPGFRLQVLDRRTPQQKGIKYGPQTEEQGEFWNENDE